MQSYTFYKAYKFKNYTEKVQQQLMTYKDTAQKPIIITQTDITKGNWVVYHVDFDNKVEKDGYVYTGKHDEPYVFNFYFQENKFDAWYDSEKNIVIFKASYKTGNALLNKTNAFPVKGKFENPSIQIEHYDFDLRKISKKVVNIYGAWFSNLKEHNTKSSSIYGPKVDDSHYYKTMDSSGEISALYISLLIGNKEYSCIISRNNSITVQTDISDETTEIEVIAELLKLI